MSAPVHTLPTSPPPPAWDADVLALAQERQVEHCLVPLWEAVSRLFPDAVSVRVYVLPDEELRDWSWIVYDVAVAEVRRDELRSGWDGFRDAAGRLCPPTPAGMYTLRVGGGN